MASFQDSNPGHGNGSPRYPGTFMLSLREAIDRLGWTAQVWRPGSVVCLDAASEQREVGFDNLFRRLRREARETWPDLLVDLLGSVPADVGKLPEDLNQVAEHLLVRLGPPVRGQTVETGVWSMPLVDGHLSAFLVVDFPSSMSYVNETMIASSGQGAEHWFQRGLANLRDKSAPTCFAPVHDESGLLQAQASDAYDSSRALLVDDLIPGYEENGFYVIVPGRDHCFVLPVTAESLMLGPWMRSIAIKMCKDMPYPISPELFWVRGGLWHHFLIEEAGGELQVTPPAAFVDVMERMRPDLMQSDPEQDDSDTLPD